MVVTSEEKDRTHYGYYAVMSIAYFGAMVSSNWALKFVPYPMQVICKSAKPIPVLILAVLIGRKSYTPQRYFFVFTIVIGVVLFVLKTSYKDAEEVYVSGYILLAISLTLDGFLGAMQERLRASSKPTAFNMMYGMNVWSVSYLGVIVLLGGEYCKFYEFVQRHPTVLYHIGLMSLAGLSGQIFIYNMITRFGSLPCSIVTTSRKFFTALFSIFYFNNALTSRQWIGMILVFAGLFADAFFGKRKHNADDKNKEPNKDVEQGDNDKELIKIEVKDKIGTAEELEPLQEKPVEKQ